MNFIGIELEVMINTNNNTVRKMASIKRNVISVITFPYGTRISPSSDRLGITIIQSAMDILKLNFTIFNYCGIWWPDQTRCPNPSLKESFYNILTVFTLTSIYAFTLMELLDMVFGEYNIDEITNNSFMLLTMSSLCFKVTNFLIRRKSIVDLLNILRKDICQAHNDTETKIQKRFDDIARSDTLVFGILVEATIAGFLIIPIVGGKYNNRILPFKAWVPFSLSNLTVYWAIYLMQSVSITIAANLNVVSDTLVSGLLVQACAQLDILGDRVTNLVKSRVDTDDFEVQKDAESTVNRCVQHHTVIYKFAAKVQGLFSWVMFFQFFVSIATLCSSVIKLSQKNAAGVEIATLVGYLACILLQLLFYCWHGNEVKLKSLSVSDAVFVAEWTMLKPKTIKSLTIIMARSNIPIQITCGSMFTLSLKTYAAVLKASYSAFNVLQSS